MSDGPKGQGSKENYLQSRDPEKDSLVSSRRRQRIFTIFHGVTLQTMFISETTAADCENHN